MTQLQINKTWNDRMTGNVINHFFENMTNKNFTDLYNHYCQFFNSDGSITYTSYRQNYYDRYHNTGMRMFLCSKEALDEVDNLNQTLFNKTTNVEIPTDSVYYTAGARNDAMMMDSIWETYSSYHFGTFINNYIVGKETAYWKPITNLNFDNFTVDANPVANTINVKYSVPFQLGEHFNYNQYTLDGNTDLFLVIPYIRYDGYRSIEVQNPTTGYTSSQSSYIALKITDLTGDGDIKFDHIDDIDYIDKLEFTLTTPHLI